MRTEKKLYLIISVFPSIIKLLKYSFESINFKYEYLTPKEKECVSREDFEKIKLLCKGK
jgi:hypothetical protein